MKLIICSTVDFQSSEITKFEPKLYTEIEVDHIFTHKFLIQDKIAEILLKG